jgi:hypothetical protein
MCFATLRRLKTLCMSSEYMYIGFQNRYSTKAIPVIGPGGLWCSEMLKVPQYLDNRLTDGGKVVSLKHRPRSSPQKHYFSASDTHFC